MGTELQALGNALGAGKGQGLRLPVDGGIVAAEPREAEDDRAVGQPGDVQGEGFGMVAWGSNLGWVKTDDNTGSRRTSVDGFNRYGMGVGVGDETVVRQELGVNKVA